VPESKQPTLAERVWQIEQWQQRVGPMLARLSEDQAYRERWIRERNTSRSRRRRAIGWAVSILGGLVVAAASIVSLVHALF
jgi:hypothetical protein